MKTRKPLFTAIFLMFSAFSYAQGVSIQTAEWKPVAKDTVIVKDTVVKNDTVLMAAFERLDTVKSQLIYIKGKSSVKYVAGYVVKKGFVVEQSGMFQWIAPPQPQMFLDHRKRKIDPKKVLQFL